VRGRALARHRDLIARSEEALHRGNWHWSTTGYRDMPAASRAAYDEMHALQNATIFGMTDVPEFAALYLRWEIDFPHDWGAAETNTWSPWSRKEGLLRRFGGDGVPDEIKVPIAGLLDAVLRRPYRCKDWIYAQLARHVDYVGRLEALRHEQPLRAEFVRHVIDNPQVRITHKTWARWLDVRQG
jgi:hypothetical protein